MRALSIIQELAESTQWPIAHQSPELTVFEIAEGLRDNRTQFVEFAYIAGDVYRYGAANLPEMLQLISRIYECSGDFYEESDCTALNTMQILSQDFRPFGIARAHPVYYVTCTLPLSNLSIEILREMALALAYVADTYEFNLHEDRRDQF